jgi:hypothetical protein
MTSGSREDPLAQFGREIVVDDQLALQDRMGFGMGVADGMAVMLKGTAISAAIWSTISVVSRSSSAAIVSTPGE